LRAGNDRGPANALVVSSSKIAIIFIKGT